MKLFAKKEKASGLISSSDLKRPKYKLIYACMVAFMVFMALIVIVPALWILVTGFKGSQEIYKIPATFFPEKFSLSRIPEAWIDLDLGTNIISTFVLAILEVAAMLVVCGFGGYVISKLKPKGIKLIFVLVVWTMMMPSNVRLVPLYMSFVDFPIGHISLLDTYWPLVLIAAANAFNMVLFKNFFDGISTSLIEAAKIDGCGDVGVLFRIMLPLSIPAVAYTAITTFNVVWSDFMMPMLVLGNRELQPLPVVIYRIKATTNIKINNYIMALSISCIPPLIVYAFAQKYIMGGINVGGVKG